MGIKDVLKIKTSGTILLFSRNWRKKRRMKKNSWIITIVVTINLEFCKNNIPLINKRATNSNVIVWNLSLFVSVKENDFACLIFL